MSLREVLEIDNKKHLSEDGFMLNAAGVYSAKHCRLHVKHVQHIVPRMISMMVDNAVGSAKRKMAIAEHTFGKKVAYYWADADTGTMYRCSDGVCMSSKMLRMAK